MCEHARLMHVRQHLCVFMQSFLRNSPAELTNEIAEGDVIVEVDKCVCVCVCVCVYGVVHSVAAGERQRARERKREKESERE